MGRFGNCLFDQVRVGEIAINLRWRFKDGRRRCTIIRAPFNTLCFRLGVTQGDSSFGTHGGNYVAHGTTGGLCVVGIGVNRLLTDYADPFFIEGGDPIGG